MTTNEGLYERGLRVIPGGVNSPVRAFRSVGGTPYFVDRAEGPYVWDVEGRRFVDLVQSYGASILGHAAPPVVAAVRDAVTRGSTYGAPTEGEVRLVVNWKDLGALPPGPAKRWSAVREVVIPASALNARGRNVIGFVARGDFPDWALWGVRDVSVVAP